MIRPKVGALALDVLQSACLGIAERDRVISAIADLRALMTALECATGTAENNYARAIAAESALAAAQVSR